MSFWRISLPIVLAMSIVGRAQDPAEKVPAAEEQPAPAAKPLPGQQDLDNPVEPLVPQKPRSLEDDNRLKAGSWLAVGRVLEAKSDLHGAMQAYKKAVGFDPQAAEIYRALVRIAGQLNQQDEAIEWADKAAELDPEEFMLRVQLGQIRMAKRDPAGALKYWEEAVKSPKFRKQQPGLYVTLMRELSIIYLALGRQDEGAKSLEVVFNALVDSGDVHLELDAKSKLLGQDPAETFEQFGQVFLETKRYDLAIKAYEQAAERKPGGSANLSYNLARIYLETDKTDLALEKLQEYFDAQRQSKGRDAYDLLGQILKKKDLEKEFLSRIEVLAEKDSRNSTLQYYLADQYRAAGRLDDAERVYRKTLLFAAELTGYQGLAAVYRQQGKPAQLLEMLARAYSEANDIDQLKTEFKAVAADAKLLDGLTEAAQATRKDNKLDFSSSVVMGSILAEANRSEPAVEFFRYALSLRKAKDAYYGIVDALFDLRKYADAVKVLEEAEQEGGEDQINYLFTLVRARAFANDTPGALNDLKRLRRIRPELADNPQIDFQEAWIYYNARQFDEAIPRFEKIISTQNKAQFKSVVRQAQFSLSNCYVLMGDYRRGEQVLEEVYKESPDDPSVNNDLGYLYADQGKNLEQAEQMIRKALAAEPENAAYLDSMGWVLFKLGKVEEAIPFLEKACAKSTGGGDDTLFEHLGDAYDKAQQPAKALETWKKARQQANEATRPDKKLIDRLEEKIKARETDPGKLKPAQPGSP